MSGADSVAKVLVLASNPLVRKGIEAVLAEESDLTLVAVTDNTQKAVGRLKKPSIDIAILDQYLIEGGDNLEIVREVKEARPNLRILAMTFQEGYLYYYRVREAGADGLYIQAEPLSHFVRAVRKIKSGKQWFPEPRKPKSIPLDDLSESEMNVFEALGRGYTIHQIANRSGRAPKTIQTFARRMRLKLGIEDFTSLLDVSREWVFGE